MNQKEIIQQTKEYVREKLKGEGSGHDWHHVERVWKNAVYIGEKEGADLYVVQLGALLHDIADWKFYDGDETIGPKLTEEWLRKLQVDPVTILHTCSIIKKISFKGANYKEKIQTLEGKCVQDADRLDAIGAIGIARCFTFGGNKGNIIYDPLTPIKIEQSIEEYKLTNHPQINHFYEKLLLLKDLMNTETAKKIAEERHNFMELFLEQFFKEWKGNYSL